jgi:hypothetical protein
VSGHPWLVEYLRFALTQFAVHFLYEGAKRGPAVVLKKETWRDGAVLALGWPVFVPLAIGILFGRAIDWINRLFFDR